MTTDETGVGRVLHVAHNVRPHIGGIETVVAAETQALRARGWRVTIVSSADAVGAGTRDEDGVRTARVRAWNGLEERFGVPFPIFSPRLVLTLCRHVRRADVVHLHDVLYLTSWVAAFWCLALRTPYVVHRHVGFVHHSSALVRLVQGVVLATFGRMVLRGARTVLPIDEHIAATLTHSKAGRSKAGRSKAGRSKAGRSKVSVLGNGVDTVAFRPASAEERRRTRETHGLPLDRPLALFVGRFVPKKGFDVVAAAAGDDYEITFVGGARPAGVSDVRLHFPGAQPAAAMPAVYACADVMIVASVGECPLTVLEAMSSGLPVLVNDDPALHSPWTAGPGVRFVDMAGGELAEALRQTVADPEAMRRTGSAGHDFVQAAFSWDAHVDRLEEVYLRNIGERRK